MAGPPFDILEAKPALTDIVSQHPADERAYRDMVESMLALEHDMGNASATKAGRHKFGVGSTATRDAITTWVVGSVWFNTITSPATMQRVVSVSPVVWEDISGPAATAIADPAAAALIDLGRPRLRAVTALRALSSLILGSRPVITKVVKQVFTASGTYTPTAGMQYCEVEAIGPGGGGGGADTTADTGGGGGAGETVRSILTAVQIGTSQVVTIGAGGAAGDATGTNGSAGTPATSLGALVIAQPGQGGQGDTAANGSTGGTGGTGGTGDDKTDGGDGVSSTGHTGTGGNNVGAHGGASSRGGGGRGGKDAVAGAAGKAYGSGGGGGHNGAGGAGKAGIIVITEYVSTAS